jgi:hypothetical protein
MRRSGGLMRVEALLHDIRTIHPYAFIGSGIHRKVAQTVIVFRIFVNAPTRVGGSNAWVEEVPLRTRVIRRHDTHVRGNSIAIARGRLGLAKAAATVIKKRTRILGDTNPPINGLVSLSEGVSGTLKVD